MIAIPPHHIGPFGGEPFFGLGRIRLKARHLVPHQKTQPVGPVEPARVFDLLVFPRPVETERFRELDVAPQRIVVWGRKEAAREVALVEHQALHERLAVEPEPAVPGLHGAQPEIGLYPIDGLALGVEQPGFELIEPRRAGMPGDHALEPDAPPT